MTTTLPNTPGRQAAQKKYNAKPEQKKRRASRNKARRQMIAAGKAKKGDGKDVGHKNGNPMIDRMNNYILQSKHSNRSYPRTKNAHKKNPKD
jgi:hypothetical protein